MKKIVFVAILAVVFACNTKDSSKSGNKIVSNFLKDVSWIEEEEHKFPIQHFQEVAAKQADEVVTLTKKNIKLVLEEAKEYKDVVIVVSNHTIIKLEDINNCKQSGSWNACMPYGKGYIRKGKFVYKEDYINNIIGRPSNEKRIVYLFNKHSK